MHDSGLCISLDSDSGLQCKTPCGQDGKYQGKYWCYTDNKWDFCQPNSIGEFPQ